MARETESGREHAGRLAQSAMATLQRVGRRSAGADLVLVPQDLRTADPSLAAEIALGTFGLAGAIVDITGTSPFKVTPPTPEWHDALHGFVWLTDLRAAGHEPARRLARRLLTEWLQLNTGSAGAASRPDLIARRTIAWLTNSGFLLEGAEPVEYEAFAAALTMHLRQLTKLPNGGSDAGGQLLVRIATVLGGLCLSDHEKVLKAELPRLLDELDQQVLPDGGHVSRHPGIIVEILLDLLPLRTCFAARNMPVPDRFQAAIDRMLRMLRYVRLGDGSIARFNGMSGTPHDRVSAILAYDERRGSELESAPQSRYVRLQRRQSIVLLDAGGPPAQEMTGEAHAGCLAFEMSVGRFPLIVNCGAPGLADQDWRLQGRATASHSALVLADQASSQLVRSGAAFDRIGKPLLQGPLHVEAQQLTSDDGASEVKGSHDGYLSRFGVLLHRSVRLTPQGDRLDGFERVHFAGRFGGDRRLAFAVHFHTHPSSKVTRSREGNGGEITLANGESWRLTGQGAVDLMLEESIFLAHISGPMRSMQLVLRGVAEGDTELRWRLERVRASEPKFRRKEPL